MRSRPFWLALALSVGAALLVARAAHASFVTFESGQVRPLAMNSAGTQLYAVNTPDNRLEIFNIDANGDLDHAASVPVGLEPVAVAVRPDDSQVWVVNHLSDSVSIVDVTGAARVIRTLLVGDEPRDIVFAGGDRAFISAAHRGQNTPLHASIITELTTAGLGRADVWVFEAGNLGTSLGGTPLTRITLFTDTPRALAASPDGSIVYAAGFHTGNQTTTVSEGVVCDDTNLNNNTPQGSCTVSGTTYPGGLPNPEKSAGNVNRVETGLIVKFNQGVSQWRDQLNRNWNNAVKFNLPDRDVFSIDADAATPAPVAGPTAFFAGVGTILFNMAVNPISGNVYVSNTEARNEVRFEGPGIIGGSTVRSHLHEARITVLQGTAVLARHLNKHITALPQGYSTDPVPAGVKDDSLATPTDMVISSNGSTLYVAAFSSGKVGVYDTTQLELNTFSPSLVPHIVVSGGGPSGLVLNEGKNRLYVFTRFDNAVSVVNTATNTEIDHQPVFNPEPPTVVNGRPFLYDALVSSANGEASCAACHIFGDFDSLGWDLGNPDELVLPNNNPFRLADPQGTSFPDHHPMKGPMTTQSLRGMDHHGSMHWRGDRSGAYDPGPGSAFDEDAAFKRFNPAFVGLLGNNAELSAAQMQAFTDFILQVTYPPNPIRNLDNSLTTAQANGENFFFNSGNGGNSDIFQPCDGCHVLNRSYGFFGSDGCSSFENETQLLKVAHLRNMYQKVGMFGMPAIPFINTGDNGHKGNQIRGFGFLHDGSIDTVFRFHNATVFNQNIPPFGNINPGGFPNGVAGDPQRREVEAFMLVFDSNLAPIVGQQVTLSNTNGATVGTRINLLIAQAGSNYIVPQAGPPPCDGQNPADHPQLPATKHCDLIVKGTAAGLARGWLYQPATALFRSDRASEPLLTDAQLRTVANTGGQELTYTCVPPLSGQRIGIDRDEDGYFDRDELDAGSDPADPLSIPAAASPTPTATASRTSTATSTRTPTATPTATATATTTNTFTATATATHTHTATHTFTATATSTFTPTRTPSATRTHTPTRTHTFTPTFTAPPGSTSTPTDTPTTTPTRTPTATRTHTPTSTATASPTLTHTATPVLSPTPTLPLGCAGPTINEPRLKISRNGAPAGDEALKLRGSVTLSGSINPAVNGFTFSVHDQNGALISSRTLPGGAAWKVNGAQTKWIYKDSAGSIGGITRVIVQNRSASTPGLHKVKVVGKAGDFLVHPAQTPVQIRIDLGPGLCATAAFNGPNGPAPLCQMSLARLKCQ